MKQLNEKVAIVTGGAMGNGLGIVKVFLKYGAKVAIFDYSEKVNEVTEFFKAEGYDLPKPFIDINGNSIKGIAWYDDISYECDGMIEYAIGGKYGFLNTQGEIVMQPTYNSIFRYPNGYYSVRKRINSSVKYGLLDSEGTIVVPCIYDNAIALYNGIAIVEKDGMLGLVDLYGNAYFCE